MSTPPQPHDLILDLTPRRPDNLVARREGSWADTTTDDLLAEATAILDSLEFSAELAWAALAWVDAALAVVVCRTGTDPDVLDDDGFAVWGRARNLLVRAEVHRAALLALEDDTTFVARCAAALVALDGVEVGFADDTAERHVPDFARADDDFARWRGAVTQGCASPVPRPDYDALVASVASASTGTRVLAVLDWVDVVDAGRSARWVPQLLAAALGRYGTYVRIDAPRDAVVAVPAVVARFVTVAALGRYAVVAAPITDDPLDVLDAVGESLECFADQEWRTERIADRDRFAAAHRGAGVLHSTLP